MTRDEALSILKTFRITGDKAHEAFDMAIKALEIWDNLFKSYEVLTKKITENEDIKNATKRIDDWCIEQLRGIISDYYTDLILNEVNADADTESEEV